MVPSRLEKARGAVAAPWWAGGVPPAASLPASFGFRVWGLGFKGLRCRGLGV